MHPRFSFVQPLVIAMALLSAGVLYANSSTNFSNDTQSLTRAEVKAQNQRIESLVTNYGLGNLAQTLSNLAPDATTSSSASCHANPEIASPYDIHHPDQRFTVADQAMSEANQSIFKILSTLALLEFRLYHHDARYLGKDASDSPVPAVRQGTRPGYPVFAFGHFAQLNAEPSLPVPSIDWTAPPTPLLFADHNNDNPNADNDSLSQAITTVERYAAELAAAVPSSRAGDPTQAELRQLNEFPLRLKRHLQLQYLTRRGADSYVARFANAWGQFFDLATVLLNGELPPLNLTEPLPLQAVDPLLVFYQNSRANFSEIERTIINPLKLKSDEAKDAEFAELHQHTLAAWEKLQAVVDDVGLALQGLGWVDSNGTATSNLKISALPLKEMAKTLGIRQLEGVVVGAESPEETIEADAALDLNPLSQWLQAMPTFPAWGIPDYNQNGCIDGSDTNQYATYWMEAYKTLNAVCGALAPASASVASPSDLELFCTHWPNIHAAQPDPLKLTPINKLLSPSAKPKDGQPSSSPSVADSVLGSWNEMLNDPQPPYAVMEPIWSEIWQEKKKEREKSTTFQSDEKEALLEAFKNPKDPDKDPWKEYRKRLSLLESSAKEPAPAILQRTLNGLPAKIGKNGES